MPFISACDIFNVMCMFTNAIEWVNKYMYEWVNEGMNKWMKEWVNEGMSEWRKEWMKERANEGMNE